MSRTRVNLPNQTNITADIKVNADGFNPLAPTSVTITNVPDPVNNTDVVNKEYVDSSSATAAGIGPAEDGTYTDGLFVDFTPSTRTGTAVDRFNEVLKALAPSPAPALTSMSFTNSGVSGKVSFGTSNAISGYTVVPLVDINGPFMNSGTSRGIFNATTAMAGTLADNVTPSYTNSRPYPNNAFGDGASGTLTLVVNGSVVQSTDLTTFVSGSSVNAHGSGFTLSTASAVEFDNGQPLNVFMYRTGTWTVGIADQRLGYNTVQVIHNWATGQTRPTQTFSWVNDDDVDATTFTADTLDTLAMTGTKKISGVTYNTAGTAKYHATIGNAYKNTYSILGSAISFTGINCSAASQGLPSMVTQNDNVTLAATTVTVTNSSRLLNTSISLSASVDRTVQTDITSTQRSISGILLDNTTDDSTDLSESFSGEGYRIHTGVVITDNVYTSGKGTSNYTWDGSISLVGTNANYNTGLLISNAKLTYPKNTSHIPGITNGNFSTPSNGPSGNPDYSSSSGNRTYLRYFYSSGSYSNFVLDISCASTTFVPVSTGPNGNNLTVELLAPNTTKNLSNAVAWKDCMVAYDGNDGDVGCYAGTYGNSIPTSWGLTIGAKNTSTSGHVVLLRITASPSWTGSISSVSMLFE
jgi:hypothetical protein